MLLVSMTPPPYTVSYMSTIMMIYIGKLDPKKIKDDSGYWGEFKIWFKQYLRGVKTSGGKVQFG